MKPRALDLFCKAGGATKGLQMAGFHVTGVDIEPQPRYCGDAFILGDALKVSLEGYDFIWASPPCQGYSRLRHLPWLKEKQWPLLIEEMRRVLTASGIPFVIENVEWAPLCGIVLCGRSFGLPTFRHRRFESSLALLSPPHVQHDEVIGHGRMVNDRRKGTLNAGNNKGAWGNQSIVTVAGGQCSKSDAGRALGIDWMRKDELCQAIPPAYAEFIGKQALRYIEVMREKSA